MCENLWVDLELVAKGDLTRHGFGLMVIASISFQVFSLLRSFSIAFPAFFSMLSCIGIYLSLNTFSCSKDAKASVASKSPTPSQSTKAPPINDEDDDFDDFDPRGTSTSSMFYFFLISFLLLSYVIC